MKILLTMIVMLAMTAISLADERPTLRDREAPRATDLLRAKKLADQARKRLKEPPRRGAGWKHGGSGWNDRSADRTDASEPVIVELRAARRARGDVTTRDRR
jgi:hypothetical protein